MAGDKAPLIEKLAVKAAKKYYDRPERVRVEAARIAAQNAARKAAASTGTSGTVSASRWRHVIGIELRLT